MITPPTFRLAATPKRAFGRGSVRCEPGELLGARAAHATAPAGGTLAIQVPRFTATACMPAAASGMFNFVPPWGVTVVWFLTGLALMARSGWIGAATKLGLQGEARRRAAAESTAATGVNTPLSTPLRMLV